MGESSKIEWTDATHNLWWGCVEDDIECAHCYAEAFAKRTGHGVWGHDAPRRFFGAKHLSEPLKWNAEAAREGVRRRVFCGSMMDIGERRNDEVGRQMDAVRFLFWPLIEQTPWLDYLLLTKRPQNMPALVPTRWMTDGFPPNVWMGTTAGFQGGWDKRVKYLRRLPVRTRFVSCEPLLGPIKADLDGISWVIVGGESGGKSRPFDFAWARSLREQCEAANVAYFFKQAGDRAVDSDFIEGTWAPHDKRSIAASSALSLNTAPNLVLLRKKKGGDLSELRGDWPRQFPTTQPEAAE